jgi:hypothetical protein
MEPLTAIARYTPACHPLKTEATSVKEAANEARIRKGTAKSQPRYAIALFR